MSVGTTYYDVLGIQPDASADDIHLAYRKAIALVHPDRAGEAGASLATLINQAHDTLSDPAKRAQYDAELTGAQVDDDDGGWVVEEDAWVAEEATWPPAPAPSPVSTTSDRTPLGLRLMFLLSLVTGLMIAAVALGRLSPWATAGILGFDAVIWGSRCTTNIARTLVAVVAVLAISYCATIRVGDRQARLAPPVAIPAAIVGVGAYIVISRRISR